MTVARWLVLLGALDALAAVTLGAFGSHALSLSPAAQATWGLAADYLMHHALGLILIGLVAARWPGRTITWAGILLQAGVTLFSGSLFLLATTGAGQLGWLTPLGGLAMLAGWLLLALAAWRGGRTDHRHA